MARDWPTRATLLIDLGNFLGTARMAFTYDPTPLLEIGHLRAFRATQEVQLAQLCHSGIISKLGVYVWTSSHREKQNRRTDFLYNLFLFILAHFWCRISGGDCQCGDSVNISQSVFRSTTGFAGQTERRGRRWTSGSPPWSCGTCVLVPRILLTFDQELNLMMVFVFFLFLFFLDRPNRKSAVRASTHICLRKSCCSDWWRRTEDCPSRGYRKSWSREFWKSSTGSFRWHPWETWLGHQFAD